MMMGRDTATTPTGSSDKKGKGGRGGGGREGHFIPWAYPRVVSAGRTEQWQPLGRVPPWRGGQAGRHCLHRNGGGGGGTFAAPCYDFQQTQTWHSERGGVQWV